MSNEKLKSENYTNFGGLNTKISPYLSQPIEFLGLINLDFQTPGSLSERWGTTMYIGQTFVTQPVSIFEFSFLNGSSFVGVGWPQTIIPGSGGIVVGATTGQCQGLSFTLQSATFANAYAFTQYSFDFFNGVAQENISLGQAPPYLGIAGPKIFYATFTLDPILQSNNNLSVAMLDNFLFAADGQQFFKFDGVTTYPIGLPPAIRSPMGFTTYIGSTLVTSSSLYYSTLGSTDIGFAFAATTLGATFQGTSGTLWGQYFAYASYVNNRGFEGPIWPIFATPVTSWPFGSTAVALGGPYLAVRIPLSTPLQYGISQINVYTYYNQLIDAGASWAVNGWTSTTISSDLSIWSTYPYILTNQVPASGSTITWVQLGSSLGGQSVLISNIGTLPDTITQSYFPLGFSAAAGPFGVIANLYQPSYYPSILEIYSNRLMSAGYSSSPSTIWFSDTAEPEGYEPDFNFEVRTNDGDVVTAMKAYQTRLLIFKLKSFHVLTGNDPTNFDAEQVTDQYGCVNKKCVVTGGENDEAVYFLDPKGIVMWNGALPSMISRKIQPFFDNMNLSAAILSARMVHDKIRNQIICAFPSNQSVSQNDSIAVYDYLAGAWTTYSFPSGSAFPSELATAFGYMGQKRVLFGDYLGRVNQFGPSLLADNGVGFSTYLHSRFLFDMGESVQKQFRRLYLNVDAPGASPLNFNINFFQDYGSSVVLSTSMVLTNFQNRIDFGISAKSVAFEMSNLQTNTKLRIHGFTIESRLQRRV